MKWKNSFRKEKTPAFEVDLVATREIEKIHWKFVQNLGSTHVSKMMALRLSQIRAATQSADANVSTLIENLSWLLSALSKKYASFDFVAIC